MRSCHGADKERSMCESPAMIPTVPVLSNPYMLVPDEHLAQSFVKFPRNNTPNLLSLVRHLHRLALWSNRHVRRRLLRRNSKLLVLKLCETNVANRDIAHFFEAVEAREDGFQVVAGDVRGDVLQKERLVGAHVFVGHGGGAGLDGAGLVFGGGGEGRCFGGFFGEFALWG